MDPNYATSSTSNYPFLDQYDFPAPGTSRTLSNNQIKLVTNKFDVKFGQSSLIYCYSFVINPYTEENRRCFNFLLHSHFGEHGAHAVYCENVFYVQRKLENEMLLQWEVATGKVNMKMHVSIALKAVLIPGTIEHTELFAEILKTSLFQLGFQYVDSQFRFPDTKSFLSFELWPSAYINSEVNNKGELMLSFDPSNIVVDTLSVWNYIQLLQIGFECLTTNLVLKRVISQFDSQVYIITNVLMESTPMSQFEIGGRWTTYADYSWEKFGIMIMNLQQPLLLAKKEYPLISLDSERSGKDLVLIPEVCHLLGLTDGMKNAPGALQILHQHMDLAPDRRAHEMLKFYAVMKHTGDVQHTWAKWDINVRGSLITCNGFNIAPELLCFGPTLCCGSGFNCGVNYVYPALGNYWGRHLNRYAMMKPATICNWAIILPDADVYYLQNLKMELSNAASKLGFAYFDPCAVVTVMDPNQPQQYYEKVDFLLSLNPCIKMILVVFEETGTNHIAFEVVKKLTVYYGLLSQAIARQSLHSPSTLKQTSATAMMKMNFKLGGVPWIVQNSLTGFMIVGYDVVDHVDELGNVLRVGAMVSSTNHGWTKYHSTSCQFDTSLGMEHVLHHMLLNCVLAFRLENYDQLPFHIIFYRNGIQNEEDKNKIMGFEIPNMRQALEDYYAQNGLSCLFTYVVIHENNHTRVWLDETYANPSVGLVIDSDITVTDGTDFYLMAAAPHDGTAAPTHYQVLSWSPRPDFNLYHLELLTYKLCHLYFGVSTRGQDFIAGAVSIPAPVQYARRMLSFYGGFTRGLLMEAHPNLALSLHFL